MNFPGMQGGNVPGMQGMPGMPGLEGMLTDIPIKEIEKMEALFSRVRTSCFSKCVQHFAESDIHPGEAVCIDRCVVKFMKVYDKVTQRLTPSTLPL